MSIDYLGEDADLSSAKTFFSNVFSGDENLVDYMRRFMGYLLTGEISSRDIHILWGGGSNGKSTLIKILTKIMGKFSSALSEDVMKHKVAIGASPELIPLMTARVGILPESGKEEELNPKRIKSITGDDTISARALYGQPVEFSTQCKLILATNFKPKIDTDDDAILARLKTIPFTAKFDNTQANVAYVDDLVANHIDEFFTWF